MSELPTHKVGQQRAEGASRTQIRAIVPSELAPDEAERLAVSIADTYKPLGDRFLIYFFDDSSALDGWDGSGALEPQHQPYLLHTLQVQPDDSGRLAATGFGPGSSGRPRE